MHLGEGQIGARVQEVQIVVREGTIRHHADVGSARTRNSNRRNV